MSRALKYCFVAILVGVAATTRPQPLSVAAETKRRIVHSRPILAVETAPDGLYYVDDGANVFRIGSNGRARKVFSPRWKTRITLVSLDVAAGRIYLFGPQSVLCFNFRTGSLLFRSSIAKTGYVLSHCRLGNSRYLMGIVAPDDGVTVKSIDQTGKVRDIPFFSATDQFFDYSEMVVSSDEKGRIAAAWNDTDGLEIRNLATRKKVRSYSGQQLASLFQIPRMNFSISSMVVEGDDIVISEYLSGKIARLNWRKSGSPKVFNSGLKSIQIVSGVELKGQIAVADSKNHLKLLNSRSGGTIKSWNLKSAATTFKRSRDGKGVVVGQSNGILYRGRL